MSENSGAGTTVEEILTELDEAMETRADWYSNTRPWLERTLRAIVSERDRYEEAIAIAIGELSQDHGDLWPHAGWHLQQRLEEVLAVASPAPATASPAGEGGMDRPTITVLCGSGRFREAFEEAEFEETLAGKIVLTIGCNTKDIARDVDWQHVKPMLDELHLRKIDLADECLFLNVNDYLGESSLRELAYARSLGKPIRFLVNPTQHEATASPADEGVGG